MLLKLNTTGANNAADGYQALFANTTGNGNIANGSNSMYSNTTGAHNTANGGISLYSNTTGSSNTANGYAALYNSTGDSNIGIGYLAGGNLTTGGNNIDIGSLGVAAEAATIRLGTQGTQTKTFVAGIQGTTVVGGAAVYVTASGQLGTLTSSAKFKNNIHDMGATSDALLALRPVSFTYKPEIDPTGTPQFGLIAEEVEKVSPDLVIRDAAHQIYSVRYEAVNAMLLNEFQKQHETITGQEKMLTEQQKHAEVQDKTISEQEKMIIEEKRTIAQQGTECLTEEEKDHRGAAKTASVPGNPCGSNGAGAGKKK